MEPDHMEASSPVEAQRTDRRRSKITNYATTSAIMYGGILSIQLRKSTSNLPRLSGMDPLPLVGPFNLQVLFLSKEKLTIADEVDDPDSQHFSYESQDYFQAQ